MARTQAWPWRAAERRGVKLLPYSYIIIVRAAAVKLLPGRRMLPSSLLQCLEVSVYIIFKLLLLSRVYVGS